MFCPRLTLQIVSLIAKKTQQHSNTHALNGARPLRFRDKACKNTLILKNWLIKLSIRQHV